MKLKKEYAILSVVIVALGLYLFFRTSDRTTYTLPDLPAVKAQALTKIEIGKGDRSVVLTRSGDGWQVSPGDYPVDSGRVSPMLDALAGLTVTTLVSETRNYARYELDEDQQIRVVAYQDDRAVRTFRIGKAAETWRHTHVVLSDDPNVYHARGNFRQDFDQSVDDLRDKTVLKFDQDKVTTLMVEAEDRRVELQKRTATPPQEETGAPSGDNAEDDPAMVWVTTDGKTVAGDTVDKLLTALTALRCRTYLNDQEKDNLTGPAYRVRIGGEETALLEIFKPEDDTATEMTARSSLRQDPFTLSDFDIDPVKDFLSGLEGPDDQTSP